MTQASPPSRPSWTRRLLQARGRSLEITRAGKLFILLTLAVGFAAINSGANLLHAVFGAQLAMIIGSGLLSEAMVRRIDAQRVPLSTLHAGMPAAMRVEVSNTDSRGDVFSVSIEDDDRIQPTGHCAPVFAVRVPAGARIDLHTTATLPLRGRRRLPAMVVATRFPFGLFVKRKVLREPSEVLVFPRVHAVSLAHGRPADSGEGAPVSRRARAGEFHALREYRSGDDPRWIHWAASAKHAQLLVREHEAGASTSTVLQLAAGQSGDPHFERNVEDVASLAVALLRDGEQLVGLRYGDRDVIEAGSGLDHEQRLLGFLALVGGVGPSP